MSYSLGNRWRLRVLFVLVVTVIIFFQTLPLEADYSAWLSPDLVLAFSFAWVLRRPDAITPLLIALVTFVTDLLLQRPPGLWSIFVVIACLFLQSRADGLREVAYSVEWAFVALVIMGLFVGYQIMLVITFSGSPTLGATLLQAVQTVLIYPLITVTSQRVFGMGKPGTTEALSI